MTDAYLFRPWRGEVGPDAVRQAREAMAGHFGEVGFAPGSGFAEAVLLVVGELVVSGLRHAPRSPVADVGITVGRGQLVVTDADADAEPRLPDLEPSAMRAGSPTVAEPPAEHDGQRHRGTGHRPRRQGGPRPVRHAVVGRSNVEIAGTRETAA